MGQVGLRVTFAAAAACAVAACFAVPGGLQAGRLLAAADDPVALADLRLSSALDEATAQRGIEAALDAKDAELAQSFVDLARDRGVAVPPALAACVAAAAGEQNSAGATVGRFASGFVYGETDDLAGLAGTVASDLLVIGDVRDLVRETSRLARGEKADELTLGLAAMGLAVTASAYATLGAAAPVRVGVSIAKVAGKTGRLGARLTASIVRLLRGVVDTAALERAVTARALLEPATALRGAREAVQLERAGGLLELVGDVGRVQAKSGTRAALEGLRLAESPREVKRVAALASAKGSKTRAALKLLGRGAVALGIGLLELAGWIFWALLTFLGFCIAAKRLVERATLAFIRRRKRRRIAREAARAASAGAAGAQRSPASPILPEPDPAHASLSFR